MKVDLTLRFESEEELHRWVAWYLDGSGEQDAEFSSDWDGDILKTRLLRLKDYHKDDDV